MSLLLRPLPPKPNLRQLKRQAKNTLKAYQAGDAACLPVIRWLHQFSERADPQVFGRELSLNDVQLALGLYYGFDDWSSLKRHIENLEAEEQTPHLKRESGAACLHGLEQMDWGGAQYRRQDSFIAVLAACARSAGFGTSFETMMGISGGAFSLTVDAGVCPSGGRISETCVRRALDAFGVSLERIPLDEGRDTDGVRRLREAVVESIDHGLPVPYMDGEYSLIVGYRNEGRSYICMPYVGGNGYQEMDYPHGMLGPAWWADRITFERTPMDRPAAVKASLRAAVELARSGAEGSGLNGYAKWIDHLENPPEDMNLHGNAYCYAILLTARTAAADYLAEIAAEFDGAIAEAIGRAAALFRDISERLLAGRGCTAEPWEVSWTPENRAIEAEIMRANRADEEAAIARIERALALMG